jgi:DNA-binding transcriptional LysR family regulator
MDIRQLRYFLAIANEGQITRAAKQLNMEQPPLSRQLKLMEQELGVLLFDRSGKQLQLTHAGELLRQKAERLLVQFNETVTEVKELDAGIQGKLSIGAVVSCISLLPERIRMFRQTYPRVTFKIREGDHFLLGEQLENRSIELVVTRLPFESAQGSERYASMPLPSDPFVAVIPSSWNRDAERQTMTMRELAGYPFITLKTDKTTGMHDRVLQEFKQDALEPQIICECSSVAITVALVAAGLGATILPKSVMTSFAIPDIQMIAIPNAGFQTDVGIVWLKDRYLSKSARRFMETFLE